jgi:DNA end-binding protein Ku
MPHAIWKGSISFGLVQIPVNLYSGEKRDELSFVMLDKRDMSPVGYKRVSKETGKEVPWEDIVKGYEYDEGRYVALGDEDFKSANVEATQTVEILAFVDAGEVPPIYFDRPYYLEPTAKGRKGYALLRDTLKKSGKAGVAMVVVHTRQYLALLMPYGDALILNLLRFQGELKDLAGLDIPGGKPRELGITEKEMQMAERLVEGMVERWEPAKYRDTYKDDLMALIKKKVKAGGVLKVAAPPEAGRKRGAEIIDIMTLLKKSIDQKAGRKADQKEEKKASSKGRPGSKKVA